jgi:hypothetical protein
MRGDFMRKFFGNLYIILALLLVSLVAVPWNDFTVWGLNIAFLSTLTDNEFVIKFGILAFLVFFSLLYLFKSNREYKKNKKVSGITALSATVPLIGYGIAFLSHLTYMIYTDTDLSLGIGITNFYSVLLLAGAALILLTFLFAHLFIKSFKSVGNFGRFGYFMMFFLSAAAMAGAAYAFRTYQAVDYPGMSARYMILFVPLVFVFYIIHIIVLAKKKANRSLDEAYDQEEMDDDYILSDNEELSTAIAKADPKEDMYQEVNVDPEFSKQAKQRSKPNSIEYYIKKPKMFKSLNPTFDKLVAHVREFPDVITKMDQEKITFYVARRPFLVLMNYGDYYRLAFRYELEEGIRLIIKYPTISKNKSTREELWFKANNYGDLPKEVIYKIVKNAYDVVSR